MTVVMQYRELRAEGLGVEDAVMALVRRGVSLDDAVAASFESAGQKQPEYIVDRHGWREYRDGTGDPREGMED